MTSRRAPATGLLILLFALDLAVGPARGAVDTNVRSTPTTAVMSNGRIAFARAPDGRDDGWAIFTVRADGSGLTRLTFRGDAFSPRWSPTGDRIAYLHLSAKGDRVHVVVMGARGNGKRVVAEAGDVGFSASSSLEWSPDGEWIAFQRYSKETSLDLWRVRVDDGYTEPLVVDSDVQGGLAWSPTGDRIAYESRDDSSVGSQVYVLDLATGTATQVTFGDPYDGPYAQDPAWSPDGAKLSFSQYWDVEDGVMYVRFDLGVVDADGTDKVIVTHSDVDEEHSTWRPQGGQIAYARGDHGGYRDPTYAFGLSTIAPDGSQRTRVSASVEQGPTWSPDGRFLVAYRSFYNGYRKTERPGVVVMRRDGTHLRRIASGNVYGVDWQPRPPSTSDTTQ